ncbi:MAG: lamin tail domain-containing protein [Elusimicrobiota bacterium]
MAVRYFIFLLPVFIICGFAYSNSYSLVINEVMANADDESGGEFIELYNADSTEININGYKFTDGDGLDNIVPWDPEAHGVITDSKAVFKTFVVPAGAYAVILDADYAGGSQVYDFGNDAVIFTTKDSTLGGSGLSNSSDPITLFDSSGTCVSTYGTPKITESPGSYLNADDDGLDGIPFDPGNGISVERINALGADTESNWKACETGATPGMLNSISQIDEEDILPQGKFHGYITEIMPYSSEKDWVELYITESEGSIGGYKLYEGAKLIKTFPDIIPSKNSYILIYFNSSDIDEASSVNNTLRFYTTDTGLAGTDNTIILRNRDNEIIDFIAYANNDTIWSDANKLLFEEGIDCGQWLAVSNDYSQEDCVVWGGSTGSSIKRKQNIQTFPLDTNSAGDWIIDEPDPGAGYNYNITNDKDESIDCLMAVPVSVFSPFGEGKHRNALIKINTHGRSAGIKIFDIQGRMVKDLWHGETDFCEELIWDGTDENGVVLPIGMYVIYAEAVDKETGKTETNKRVVVISKRL